MACGQHVMVSWGSHTVKTLTALGMGIWFWLCMQKLKQVIDVLPSKKQALCEYCTHVS